MKHIVCYSGGHSSALVAIELVRKYGKENVILVNHECKLEDDDVSRFEKEIADYLGLPIVDVSFKDAKIKDQFDVVMEKGSFININSPAREALCTHVMKTEPFMAWLAVNFKPYDDLFGEKEDCIIYYGFDKEETARIQRRSTIMAAMGYKTYFQLAHGKRTIFSTIEIGVEPPNTYTVYKHANCKGCLKAGWQHWYCVYVLEPPIYQKGILSEDTIGYTIHKDASLEEKSVMFEKMVKCGIEPTEKIPSQTWWAMVKRVLKEYDNTIIEIPEEESKPCECLA